MNNMSARWDYGKLNGLGGEEFQMLGRQLNAFYVNTVELAQQAQANFRLRIKEKENKCSRDNLLCYLALRKHDLSDLQLRLAEQGLSSLGMLEGEVLVSIEQVLKHFGIRPGNTSSLCKINSKSAGLLLGKRSKLLFGSPSQRKKNVYHGNT